MSAMYKLGLGFSIEGEKVTVPFRALWLFIYGGGLSLSHKQLDFSSLKRGGGGGGETMRRRIDGGVGLSLFYQVGPVESKYNDSSGDAANFEFNEFLPHIIDNSALPTCPSRCPQTFCVFSFHESFFFC